MSKIFDIVQDLKACYEAKAPHVEDYVKLSYRERESMCSDVRKSLVNYVNSSEYCFLDIAKNLYDYTSCKFNF